MLEFLLFVERERESRERLVICEFWFGIYIFQESILLWQRKCEDALYSLLILGARRPVRHLASVAMAMIIFKGDPISIYSRVSSLQGFLSDGKKSEPQRVAGWS